MTPEKQQATARRGAYRNDSDDAAIVSAIVALGQALGLRIVAEGVETDVQQSFLTRLGCNSLQGYLLGHPLPADGFMADILRAEDAQAPDKNSA